MKAYEIVFFVNFEGDMDSFANKLYELYSDSFLSYYQNGYEIDVTINAFSEEEAIEEILNFRKSLLAIEPTLQFTRDERFMAIYAAAYYKVFDFEKAVTLSKGAINVMAKLLGDEDYNEDFLIKDGVVQDYTLCFSSSWANPQIKIDDNDYIDCYFVENARDHYRYIGKEGRGWLKPATFASKI
jgi:hypothetical protein